MWSFAKEQRGFNSPLFFIHALFLLSNQKNIIMSKVAKLVCISLMTRVIVEDGLSEDEELNAIADQVRAKCINQISTDGIGDILESIELDEECPYGTFNTDKE